MMKVCLSIFILFSLFACNQEAKTSEVPTKKDALSPEVMVIETIHGTTKLKFYPNAAPQTVKRITNLIKSGFYNGLKFHRVVPKFVVQGGDPQGNGTGGSGQKIPAEFNSIPHEIGTLAMARSRDPNSADSQFYICLERLASLDGKYTVFGKVIEGMEYIKKIKVNDIMTKVYLK